MFIRRSGLVSGVAVGAVGLVLRQLPWSSGRRLTTMNVDLGSAILAPVRNGAIVNAAPIKASSLWSDSGALVFVVRRPG